MLLLLACAWQTERLPWVVQFKQLFALFDSNVAKAATMPGFDAGIIQASLPSPDANLTPNTPGHAGLCHTGP